MKVSVTSALTPVARWPGREWDASSTLPYSGGTCAAKKRAATHVLPKILVQPGSERFLTTKDTCHTVPARGAILCAARCHPVLPCAILCQPVPACAILCHPVPCCALLCHPVLPCAALCQTVPPCAILCHTVPYYAGKRFLTPCHTVPARGAILCHPVLPCAILYHTVPYYAGKRFLTPCHTVLATVR